MNCSFIFIVSIPTKLIMYANSAKKSSRKIVDLITFVYN